MTNLYVENAAAVSPLGDNLDVIWNSVLEGRSVFNTASLPGEHVFFAAECEENSASNLGQYATLFGSTIKKLVDDLGIEEQVDAVFFATAVGNLAEIENEIYNGNPIFADMMDFSSARNTFDKLPCISSKTKFISVPTGCCAGMQAIGLAKSLMHSMEIESAIVMSLDFGLTPLAFSAFSRVNATKPYIDGSTGSPSRPFCEERGGFLFADGGGAIYVKRNECKSDKPRISGYGCVSSAFHMIDISTDGKSIRMSMEKALTDASVSADQIDHVNLHASGTKQNDEAEYRALIDLIGNDLPDITTFKGNHGHALGGANMIEIALSWKILMEGIVPPTPSGIPFDAFEFAPPRNKYKEYRSKKILKTASGFSGIHASLIMEY